MPFPSRLVQRSGDRFDCFEYLAAADDLDHSIVIRVERPVLSQVLDMPAERTPCGLHPAAEPVPTEAQTIRTTS